MRDRDCRAARIRKLFAAEPLCSWFNNEQIEEESNTDKAVRQIEMVGDSKQGLFMLDREMGARIAYDKSWMSRIDCDEDFHETGEASFRVGSGQLPP